MPGSPAFYRAPPKDPLHRAFNLIVAMQAKGRQHREHLYEVFGHDAPVTRDATALNHQLADLVDLVKARMVCVTCGHQGIREVLDGDPLCQQHCDAWARGQALNG